MIATMVRRAHLLRVHHGVYLVGHAAPIELGDETAALLACRDASVLSHRTAAALWELLPPSGGPIEVTLWKGRRMSARGITAHRTRRLEPRDLRLRKGLPVTAPGRTLLDVACQIATRELERALDEALIRRLTTLPQLLEVVNRGQGRQGRATLARLLQDRTHTTITRSEAEERFLALVRRAELPPPEVNVKLHGYTVDFYWRRAGVVVEIDGYAFHSTKSAFERDRRKDAVLKRSGLSVIRITWSQLTAGSYAVIADLAVAIARGLARAAA